MISVPGGTNVPFDPTPSYIFPASGGSTAQITYNSTDNTFTVPVTGDYLISYGAIATENANIPRVAIAINGTEIIGTEITISGSFIAVARYSSSTTILPISTSDKLSLMAIAAPSSNPVDLGFPNTIGNYATITIQLIQPSAP